MGKRVFIIVVVVAGVLAAATMGIEAWLRHSIRGAIERALDGVGAEVELGRVSVSLPLRQVAVRDVRVRAHGDDAARRGRTLVSLDVTIPRVIVRGVGYDRVKGERVVPSAVRLNAARLTVESPLGTLVTRDFGDGGEMAADAAGAISGLEKRPGRVAVRVDELRVTGAALELVQWLAEGEHTRTVIGGGGLSARDVTLDSIPVALRVEADSVVHAFGGGLKVLRGDSLVIETTGGGVSLAGLSLVPRFEKEEFARRAAGREDWTSVRLGGVACRGVDFSRLLAAAPALCVDSVSIGTVDVASYKDRNVASTPREKQMIYEAVQRLPVPVEIGMVEFDDLDIAYEELALNGGAPGAVTLSGGHGRVVNLTNVATEGRDRFMTVDLSASLMRSGDLEVRLLMPVDPADDHWELSGRLGATDMGAFNGVLEPLMNVRVTSGAIRGLDFHIVGTLARSHTRLTMAYDDLRVEFLDPRDHAHVRKFLTAIADDVVIRPDNPGRDGRGRLRSAGADAVRDPQRSMWNYIWRSIEGAILRTVI